MSSRAGTAAERDMDTHRASTEPNKRLATTMTIVAVVMPWPTSDSVKDPRSSQCFGIAPSAPVEVILPNGAVIRIAPGCDLAFVRSLIDALAGAPC